MANYSELIATINDQIKANGNQEITGPVLNAVLQAMVSALGEGYQFMGVATPDTNPGTPDAKVFYLATEAGTYVNFGHIVINKGEAVILSNKTGNWVKTTSGFATQQQLTELDSECFKGYKEVSLFVLFENKAITDKGQVIDANGFRIYRPVYFSEGTQVRIESNGYDLSALSLLNNDGTYTPEVIYTERLADVNISYYTIPSDGLYVLSSSSIVINDFHFWGKLYSNQPDFNYQFIPQKKETYKAVLPDGNVEVTTPPYYISNPFVLKAGMPIRIKSDGWGIAVLSKVENGKYIPVLSVEENDGLNVRQLDFIINETALYVISSNRYLATISSYQPICSAVEENISLVAGNMLGSLGVQVGATINSDNMLKSFITENYIKFNGETDSIFINNRDAKETLYIWAYDSNFKFITQSSILDIPKETRFIKITIFQSEIYSNRLRILNVTIANNDGCISYFKNDVEDANGEKGVTPYWISYEIVKPTIGVKEDGNYDGNNNVRCWNNGYVMLPPNYERNGKPVPLIIVGHGTDCYSFRQDTIYWYEDLISFLARNGYAVADCSTTSSLYPDQKDTNCPTPLAMACYKGLYECVCNRFNIDRENVFMFGHSAGGMLTSIFSFQQPFPLKAVASMAGSMELITNMRILTPYTDHTFFLEQIGADASGFPQINDAMAEPNATAKEIYLRNADKLIGYNPFTIGSAGINNAELCKAAAEMPFPYGAENDQAMKSIVAKGYKMCPVPMKIWHAVDDDKVPFSMSKFYQQIVQNAGGRCEVRPLPEGTGKHGSVDVAENAPRVTYMTQCGIEMNVTIAYAEMVDWFNSFLL